MLKSRIIAIFITATVITLSILYVALVKKPEKRFFPPFLLSNTGRELCVQIGPQIDPRGTDLEIAMSPKRPHVITMKEEEESGKLLAIPIVTFIPITWRPTASSNELFGIVSARSANEPSRILGFNISEQPILTFEYEVPVEIGVWDLVWNPNGKIMAATVFSKGVERFLGILRDPEQAIIITEIGIDRGGPIWSEEDSLYVHAPEGFLKVRVKPEGVEVEELLETTGKVYPLGILDGEIAYITRGTLYHGRRAIRKVQMERSDIVLDTPHWAQRKGREITVFDSEGRILTSKAIDQDSDRLIAISSKQGFLYILHENRQIERFDYTKGMESKNIITLGE